VWLLGIFVVQAIAVAARSALFTIGVGERVVTRLRSRICSSARLMDQGCSSDARKTGELTNRLASDTTTVLSRTR
jgi:hypothetical protein